MRGFILALCLLWATTAVAQGEFWCWDADEILAHVEGDTVRIQHLAALYNCCPEPITYDVQVGDATIFIQEFTQSPCDCDCCTKTELILAEVPAGPWNILFRWFDLEIYDWTEEVIQIEVPDVGQGYEPVIAAHTWGGCIETSHVPDLDDVGFGAIRVLTNPARDGVAFSVSMPEAGDVTVCVFDVRGRLVGTVYEGFLPAGVHARSWSPRGVGAPSGIYYMRLMAFGREKTHRFVLLR